MKDPIDVLEVRLASGDGHCLYVHASAIWLAFPGGGALPTKVYLTHEMETVFPPQQLSADTPAEDMTLALFRGMLMREIGTTLDVVADVAEIADAAGLTLLTARGPANPFTIGVSRFVITGVAPAFDTESGELQGSNVFLRRICMETNGRTLPVRETPEEVLAKLGWAADRAIGRRDSVLISRPNRIITPDQLQ